MTFVSIQAMRTILLGMPVTCDEAMGSGLACDTFGEGSVVNGELAAAAGLYLWPSRVVQMAKEDICRNNMAARPRNKQIYP